MDDELESSPDLVQSLERLMEEEQRDPLLSQVPKQFALNSDVKHMNQFIFPQRIYVNDDPEEV